jgi:hypothetical protein
MPKRKKGESKSKFVSRYMDSPEAKEHFPNAKQRVAVAYSVANKTGRRRNPKP